MPRRLVHAVLAALALLALAVPAALADRPVPDEQPPPQSEPAPAPVPQPAPLAPAPAPSGCHGAAQPAGVDPRAVDPASPNPLVGLQFYVDHDEPSWQQWQSYERRGMSYDASLMWKVASEPKFKWWGRWTRKGPALVGKVRQYLDDAECNQPGAVPLMTVMRHQGKQCRRGYTAGGRREDARARLWYQRFARAVGDHRVVIAFEPDSLGTMECLAASRRKARLRLLRYGVDVLSQLPNATIYLEGGASDWEPAKRTARQLRYIGIRKVRGFMLNTTHYDWTANNIRHGLKLSRLVGGKHFIVSTAFNGRGPIHYRRWISRSRHIWRTINVWCHPLKRGLGVAPTTDTYQPKVDAFMWIGRPGYSGGRCNGGPLPVGTWWAKRALMFSQYSTDWLAAPRGTRFGLFGHHSLRELGAL